MSKEKAYITERIAVPAAFQEVFSHFYVARNTTELPVCKTLLPSFQTMMVFSFGTAVQFTSQQGTAIAIDKVMVLGPVKQPIEYLLPAGVDMLVVNFKSDGFYRFFGQAVVSSPAIVSPDELLGDNCFIHLWSLLKNKPTADRVALLLDFAKPYIKSKDTTLAQLERYADDATVNSVKAIAHATGQSGRNIQLKHKKLLGYSAKEIARYQRFLKTIGHVQKSVAETDAAIDWQEIVTQFGYYDQSQLIHDFNYYLHLSPTQFLKFQQDICFVQPA